MFSSIWLHYKNCCRKYFHVFGSILKMLFSYEFFTFSQLFSQHPNKFYYRKFQNHSQIPMHRTNHSKSQHHTPPKLQFNPRQQTPAIKSHNHQNTITIPPQQQQKSKSHRERDRWVEDWWVEGEIAQRRDRVARCDWCGAAIDKTGAIWCMWSSDWSSWDQTVWCDWCGVAIDETGAIWYVRSLDWSSRFTGDVKGVIWAPSSSSLSLSLSLSLRKPFEVKIGTEMNFHGQSLFFTVENDFWKILFSKPTKHPHLQKSIFWKWFSAKTNTTLMYLYF